MYFKRLELFGFKSFADKTVLNFEPGVTAVVGPNGCGKSNIADAIRWVLGEQSPKSMRGSKMEDVIFNGTDAKAALNLSEVSLTFSNEQKLLPIDYEEVTITRRLFRSGESEYLINNNLVRLKDINELLLGTGIGTDSYSMFEQGKMDLIISSKPEDRRFLFEEASGITLYKSKKREALRKLEQTDENLLRANDIITEVSRQLNSISRQVNKARRYKEEFEKLKDIEIKFTSHNLFHLNNNKQDTLNKISQYRQNDAQIDAQIKGLGEELEKLRISLSELEQEFSKQQKEYLTVESAIDKNEHKISLNKERVEECKKRSEEIAQGMENAAKKLQEVALQAAEFKKSLDELNSNEERQKTELKDKENRFKNNNDNIKTAQDNIDQAKLRLVGIASTQTKIKNDLAKVSANIANITARIRRLNVESDKAGQEIRDIDEKFGRVNAEVEEFNKVVCGLKDEEKKLTEQSDAEKDEINKITIRLEELNSRFSSLKTRIEFLEDMNRRYEGFMSGTRALLQEQNAGRQEFKGIVAALANVIEVESGYEQAVEIALGEKLSTIIVEDKNTALSALTYLKENNLGNTSFISLADTTEHKLAVNFPGCRPLSDVIKIEPRLRSAVEYLLKDTFVVPDFAQALKLNEENTADKFSFITPKGEIARGGYFSGGVIIADVERNIISRQAKIRDLKQEFQDLNREILSCEELKNKHAEKLNELKNSIDQTHHKAHEQELILANKQTEFENIKQQSKRIHDEFSLLKLELDESLSDEKELKNRQEALLEEQIKLDKEQADTQNLITESTAIIEQATIERESLLVDIAQLKTEIASVSQRRASAQETYNMLSLALNEQNLRLKNQTTELEDLENKGKQLNAENETLKTDNIRFAEFKEKLGAELKVFEEQRADSRKKIDAHQKLVYTLAKQQDELKNNVRDLEIKDNESTYKIQTLLNRISETYKLESSSLELKELPESSDLVQIETDINDLRAKLDRMGPVNLVAIEEEKELSDRLNFLNTQRQDLLNAQDTLHKAIAKINKTTKIMFMETFEKTKVTFRDFFRLLFGGGDAQLILLDEQDVLESGIEIIVRPPGKKLQSISLLSGGEKAMTAIALLFGIFKVKPSPFCVLDEIDAPLDESNVGRFSKVLQEFLKLSQFIIITHNKRTISMADVMYGVTMQEFGVSKIVSVKFKNLKEKEEVPQEKADLVASP